MKHIGKMKNNNAKVVVAYRTLPGNPHSALVIGTAGLGESYHNSLMDLVQDPSGQQANELAEILSVRKFPDGSNMLSWLHSHGHLRKVATDMVLMTPAPQTSIPLNELNVLIAEQKGMSLEDLAVREGDTPIPTKKSNNTITVEEHKIDEPSSPTELRSKADALFKEAQRLRRKADELDPPKKKSKTSTAEVE